MSKSEIEVRALLLKLGHDQGYVTARWAKRCSEITGIEVDMIFKGTVFLIIACLLVLKEPHYLANSLLVITPIIMVYWEPSERYSTGCMFIYWTLFGVFVLFDRVLECIPLYYILKLAIFVALFLPPSSPTIELIHNKVFNIADK